MPSALGHLRFSVDLAHLAFYRDLFAFLGWKEWFASDAMLGVGDPNGVSLWFAGATKPAGNDYDAPGLNHCALHADSVATVDATTRFLAERGVAPLFDTPRHRPEFAESPDHTYYQVMFESPDRILFEVVYIGPKDAERLVETGASVTDDA
ncbi:MAG: VOC family protein [Dehalococcoidia bacterium]|nr:VOC family protein [Dehalococcoidia bacterium]